jgi:hypothetical protein
MASTYSTSLRLELMATGDQSGTWGDTTNTNLGTLLEQAITGVLSVAQGDAELTLTSTDGASDQARNAVVNLTGAMTGAQNVIVPDANKLYLIKNSTTGGFAVTVKTSAGTGVTVPAGTARWVYADGTNVVDGMSGPWSPSSNDAQALGISGTAWSDLFLASGGVINWVAGDVTITHSTNALAFAGATSGYSFDELVSASGSGAGFVGFRATSTNSGAAAGPVLDLYRDSSSPAANDVLGQVLFNGEDSAGNTQEYGAIEALIVSPTSTSEVGALDIYTTIGGTRTRTMSVGPNNPNTTTQFIDGYATTATAAGTTTLTVASAGQQFFTGTTTQTVVLPVTSTLVLGQQYRVVNNSTGAVTVQSSGTNTIQVLANNTELLLTCIAITGTDVASWSALYRPLTAGLALLTSGAVSSAATLDIVLTSYTGYRGLLFELINFVPVTDAVFLHARLSTDGGASYDAGASDYVYGASFGNSTGTSVLNSTGAAQIAVVTNVGNLTGEGATATITLFGQTDTAIRPRIGYVTNYIDSSARSAWVIGTGIRDAAQDTDAIRFLFSSGNISSGSYAVYGYV